MALDINSELDFANAANVLLNKTIIVVNKSTQFRLVEVEFYLHNSIHPDEYTHRQIDQLASNRWYFHKFGNGTFKSGTFKGLDITCGKDGQYCGILIRSIVDLATNQIIEGPCNCVNAMLKILSVSDVKGLFEKIGNETIIDSSIENDYLYLTEKALPSEAMYFAPRIGLSDKYPEYRHRNYRFAIQPQRIKKEKKSFNVVDF